MGEWKMRHPSNGLLLCVSEGIRYGTWILVSSPRGKTDDGGGADYDHLRGSSTTADNLKVIITMTMIIIE